MAPADVPALNWSVKQSFLAYVNRSRGRITLVEPAYPGAGGFAFPYAQAMQRAPSRGSATDADECAVQVSEIAFTGGVAFSAHGGALDITLAEPIIVIDDQGALLTVIGSARPGAGTRAVIAELADQSHASTDVAIALVPLLTDDGSALFGGVYPPGEAMDPVFVPRSLLATTPTGPRSDRYR
jgi:hypothetical protein